MTAAVETLKTVAPLVGIATLCAALNLSRATFYRRRAPRPEPAPRRSPRALSTGERQTVLALLNEPRFEDQAPAEVYATLLDEGTYVCSERSMYRILNENCSVRERRDQLRHPKREVPRLVATAPNQVWSWDITKLRTTVKWHYYYLYVLIDIFSRYVVGWMVAESESAALAKRLISETCEREKITPGQLKIHADRGGPMIAKTTAQLFADLCVEESHSRPRVSNDNAYSEAHFKTLKYRPDFPERFGSLVDGRCFLVDFFGWYNVEHHHSGLALHTPYDVHHGLAAARQSHRAAVLEAAHCVHPERFVRGVPRPQALPDAAWINQPSTASPTGVSPDAAGTVPRPGAIATSQETNAGSRVADEGGEAKPLPLTLRAAPGTPTPSTTPPVAIGEALQ
jgi:putative transposase